MEDYYLNYSDIFYKKRQRDCKIVFEMGKSKSGKETIYKHTPTLNEIAKDIETDYKEITITDLWEEKRKGKTDSIIGTSIVNILNASNTLKKLFQEYKLRIKEIHPKILEELYNQVIEIKKKYGLDKLNKNSVLELYYKIDSKINEKAEYYMFEENKLVSSKEIIEQIKLSENKEYNLIYNFLKEVYSLDIEEKLGFSGQCSLIIDILENRPNKKLNIHFLFSSAVVDNLEMLMKDIEKLIGNNAVFINNSIYKFIVDLQTTYFYIGSELYKTEKYNILYKYQFEQPKNAFYNIMRKYLKDGADENSNNFLYDIVIIFISSLISDIENIKSETNIICAQNNFVIDIFKNFYSSKTELPRVQIKYKEITENHYGEKLKTPKSIPFRYEYYDTTLLELYAVTKYHLYLDNREIHKCKNCGRYFITDTKNSEIFCKRIDPKYKGRKIRYCFEIGQQENKSQNIESIKNLHHTLYNRFYSRWQKYEKGEEGGKYHKEYKTYIDKYGLLKEQWKNKEITKKQLRTELLKELEKDNKRIEKVNKKEKGIDII